MSEPPANGLQRDTILSPCRTYRYQLWREWQPTTDELILGHYRQGHEQGVVFIGLNPSTADETKDDQTIRKCIGFAKRWGYSAICMMNLFAYRSRFPKKLNEVADPIGPDNEYFLRRAAEMPLVVAAWGKFPSFEWRASQVAQLFSNLKCLGHAKGGFPRHPLMVPYSRELEDLWGERVS
jgi:hypothetical protein